MSGAAISAVMQLAAPARVSARPGSGFWSRTALWRERTDEAGLALTADPDEDLVRRVGQGDPAAIQAMVARKLPRMLALAHRMLNDATEAEDVAQEAMLRAWKQAPRWTPGTAKFDTWLHRVGLNLCYDRLRRRREIATDSLPDRADDGPAPDRGLMAADTGARVESALARLPDRQREAIVLCHYQELTNIEAAVLMKISVDALESLLSRGRRALRLALADIRPGAEGA
jgi:RNA polymerase sigma-70 factor (ECF subfamily)